MLKTVLQSILYPAEITSALNLKFGGHVKKTHRDVPLETLAKKLDNLDFCYEVLNKVSRSFAVVIQQLPEQLKDAVCVFYLVLRGLDSVEDDMTYANKDKIPLLKIFYQKLEEDDWNIEGVGDSADYRVLLKYFHKVIVVYKALDKGYRDAISNITQLMGEGMAEYAEKLGQMPTIAEYDTYCHHVAGLVGWGLSDLFSASKLEDADLKDCKQISNSMGLFLQKTNIIRDYLEDLEEGRTWWPEEIWSQYAGSLADFKDKPDEAKSLACLNHMVSDALLLVPEALEYMRKLKNPQIFSFCAIPQVMAFATLEKVYNNTQVFKGVVKVRKGLSAKMMLNCGDMQAVNNYFNSLASKMQASAKKAQDKRVQNQLISIRASCPPSYNMSYATLKQVHMVALVTLIWLLTACPCCSEGVTDCLCSASGALCAVLALTCFAFVFNIGFKMSAF